MTRSKLSDQHKQEIVQQFRESTATIVELAEQYGVSTSTIRRVLKQQLSPTDYDSLVAAKQERGTSKAKSHPARPKRQQPVAKSQRHPPAPTNPESLLPAMAEPSPELQESAQVPVPTASKTDFSRSDEDPDFEQLLAEIEHDLEDDDLEDDELDDELEDELDDDLNSDELDDDLRDDDLREDSLAGVSDSLQIAPEDIEIYPLTDATIPIPCYLVVDRSAELITCPLKSFSDLGHIPEAESQAKTLPIFENHRVARRFSHRSQRIIKIPNGNLLKKTEAQLQAKGITRLLIKGRVYAL